ncbi:DUF11 domain-containing protein, partial [Snuella lapsa]|uniref:DUF11 domain-containing protein n=1 Tax=Snuella lapsa TaxID=870481 RepID=UPI0031E8CC80
LENTGNTTVYSPVVSDPQADAGSITFVDGDTDNDGVLDVGETWNYTATHTITQIDIDSGSFTNTATADGSADTDGDGIGDTPVTDDDPDTVTAVQTASIELIKSITSVTSSGPDGPEGDIINYSFTVTNTGNVTVENIVITDPLLLFPQGTIIGIPIASLAPGESDSTTYTGAYEITAADVDAGGVENSAIALGDSPNGTDDVSDVSDTGTDAELNTVSDPPSEETLDLDNVNGDNNDGDPTNDPTAYHIHKIDLSLTKEVDVTTASVGDTVTFTVTVNNAGPDSATNIDVLDTLPFGYDYVAASISSDVGATGALISTDDSDNRLLLWMIDRLDSGESVTLSFEATVTSTNDYENGAEITAADQFDVDSDPTTGIGIDDLGDGIVDDDEDTAAISLCIDFELYVFLEGSLIDDQGVGTYSTIMRTDLNDLRLLPGQTSGDPFFGSQYIPALGAAGQVYNILPWNYSGNEGSFYDSYGDVANGDAGYPSTVTDWVLVSLRSDPTNGSEILCQRAGLLHNDGRIEFVTGADCCTLDLDQSYYVVVEHRNHLIVMSHEAVPIVDGVLTYDFRNKQSYDVDFFGEGRVGQKEVLPGVFAMYAGNGDQGDGTTINGEDTDINTNDFNVWSFNENIFKVYNIGDYDMNGDVNSNDYNLWQRNTNVALSAVPRN